MTTQTFSARCIHVTGIVQGVGFRPFIYNLARRYSLTGWVRNTSAGVEIEITGSPATLDDFLHALTAEAPPLSRIENVQSSAIPPGHHSNFRIRSSTGIVGAYQSISPDVATCDDCLAEIFDSADRRYRYPFTNCTNCGPRFTIIQDIPYDRPQTTMAPFVMCPACQSEYTDPLNRRFHAQPNACPICGPQLDLLPSPNQAIPPEWDTLSADKIDATRTLLRAGHIVAIKGLGGFHLACDATNPAAVQKLRHRKGRPAKPFAVMLPNLMTVARFCKITLAAQQALAARARPIVLLPLNDRVDHPGSTPELSLADDIAPGLDELGVMLPYTPLHHLLLTPAPDFPPALVMTSGNASEEPIITGNTDALQLLGSLADAFLLHDRDIHLRCDDSVIRVSENHTHPLRRSRGYAPYPLTLPFTVPPLLAAGAELKNTFCLARDTHVFMSQHIGDLSNYDTLRSYQHSLEHLLHLFRIEPELIAHDAHPDYVATRCAIDYAQKHNLPHLAVQHHHAHLASCLAEHKLPSSEPVIGIIFDGTGLGPDRAIWGGEILIGDYATYQRFAHLRYIPLPGGDAATLRPYRTALAHLWNAEIAWEASLFPVNTTTDQERTIIRQQLAQQINAPLTSSMGRLFDAVAALAGAPPIITYEAQAAIWLETQLDPHEIAVYRFDIIPPGDPTAPYHIDPAPVLHAVVDDLRHHTPVSLIAARFHNGVAHMIGNISQTARDVTTINTIILSGGVFQNRTLHRLTVSLLEKVGFTVYTHQLVPPNDGGLALGQAVIAAYQTQNSP